VKRTGNLSSLVDCKQWEPVGGRVHKDELVSMEGACRMEPGGGKTPNGRLYAHHSWGQEIAEWEGEKNRGKMIFRMEKPLGRGENFRKPQGVQVQLCKALEK